MVILQVGWPFNMAGRVGHPFRCVAYSVEDSQEVRNERSFVQASIALFTCHIGNMDEQGERILAGDRGAALI